MTPTEPQAPPEPIHSIDIWQAYFAAQDEIEKLRVENGELRTSLEMVRTENHALLKTLEGVRGLAIEECARVAETAKTLHAWLPVDTGEDPNHHTTKHGAGIAKLIRALSTTQPLGT